MLTNALRIFVCESFLESFYGKKKVINVLTAFSIFYKNCVKTFLKWFINNWSMTPINNTTIDLKHH